MITAIEINDVTPFEDGRTWGRTGRYEWVEADAHFAVDPGLAANQRIVDLELAERAADGRVHFQAQLRLLRPVDTETTPKLLLAVPNRGVVGNVPLSGGVPNRLRPSARVFPGDGMLLEHGWTIGWCGWQWDVLPAPGIVGLSAPLVEVDPGWVRLEWRADIAHDQHPLSDSSALFTFAHYPPADMQAADATLTVRLSPDGDASTVPRARWRFSDEAHVQLDGGFQAFHWYQLLYRTAFAPVAGVGLLAVRDLVSHLRQQGTRSAFAIGTSQAGRFLRQFVWDGFNADEKGNTVFDGLLVYAAGARRGEFNHRFAQPAVTHAAGFTNLPPFDTTSLLARQRAAGAVPKIFSVNTAWEYWRGDAALVHADAFTGADLPDDPDSRSYLIAGADHLGPIQGKEVLPVANPVQQLDPTPVLRALFVALVRWARNGESPPASEVPRWSQGTASERTAVLDLFPDVPTPDPAHLEVARVVDLGPQAAEGIGRWPVRLRQPFATVVSAVDKYRNETAGIRLPAVAVPLAAFTGWNPRRQTPGLPDVMYEFVGSQLPLPPDCSPASVLYGDPESYQSALVDAATALVDRHLLLATDVDWVVRDALALWDVYTPGTSGGSA
jgi:hypothetical protein